MRNKTLYALLFAITFSIMHDTFISLLYPHENIQVAQYHEQEEILTAIVDIHEIHNMFHFVAIAVDKNTFLDTFFAIKVPSKYIPLCNLPHKKRVSRPPIA